MSITELTSVKISVIYKKWNKKFREYATFMEKLRNHEHINLNGKNTESDYGKITVVNHRKNFL
jgi:hypothetical protein